MTTYGPFEVVSDIYISFGHLGLVARYMSQFDHFSLVLRDIFKQIYSWFLRGGNEQYIYDSVIYLVIFEMV